MNTILLIEDDIKVKKYIKDYLIAYDYETVFIEDLDNILVHIKEINPKLIILDINLPKFDGFYFLKLIRKEFLIPVIILSARSEEGEQIRGMDLGADDYITKPFSIGILLAKINALLRRVEGLSNTKETTYGDFTIIDESMKFRYKDKVIELSKNEYRMLKIFLRKIDEVVTREELLQALWDDTIFVDDNTLSVNITRLKKKLSTIGIKNVIVNKRGIGYVFNRVDM